MEVSDYQQPRSTSRNISRSIKFTANINKIETQEQPLGFVLNTIEKDDIRTPLPISTF